MRPIIERIKREYDDCRIIFVADRGLNTSDNIYWLNGDNKADVNERDGYVYGQTIRLNPLPLLGLSRFCFQT